MKSGLRVAVVGATGAVGREMLQVLSDRHFSLCQRTGLRQSEQRWKTPRFW